MNFYKSFLVFSVSFNVVIYHGVMVIVGGNGYNNGDEMTMMMIKVQMMMMIMMIKWQMMIVMIKYKWR